jgi:hypothetical protein
MTRYVGRLRPLLVSLARESGSNRDFFPEDRARGLGGDVQRQVGRGMLLSGIGWIYCGVVACSIFLQYFPAKDNMAAKKYMCFRNTA